MKYYNILKDDKIGVVVMKDKCKVAIEISVNRNPRNNKRLCIRKTLNYLISTKRTITTKLLYSCFYEWEGYKKDSQYFSEFYIAIFRKKLENNVEYRRLESWYKER